MYLVGPYLFSGDDLEGYLAGRRQEALAALAAIPADDIRIKGPATVLQSLHRRFAVPPTSLHEDEAYFAAERTLDAEERGSIGITPDDAGTFKAITIVIPFSGDEHLLTCTPTIYSAHQPQAEVKDGKVAVTYFLNEVEEAQLEHSFKRLIALIDRTLEVTQWQAMGHNEKLTEALSAAIAARAGG